jgi:hypothetical protein
MTSPPSCTKNFEIRLYPKPHREFYVLSHSQGCDSANKPPAFDSTPLTVLLRFHPPFPLYNLAGAIDGGIGENKDDSGDCGNVRAARAGVRGLPRVLLTKVLVLLRCESAAGTLSISSFGVTALNLPLVSLSAFNLSLSLLWVTVNPRALALS